VQFHTLAQGAPLGDIPVAMHFDVITDPAGWERVRESIPEDAFEAGLAASQQDPDLVGVVAFAGVKGTSGHVISITRMTRAGSIVQVGVAMSSPDSAQIVEQAKTLPYHLVGVGRSELGVTDGVAGGMEFVFRDDRGEVFARVSAL
jgi:hypothetical protein